MKVIPSSPNNPPGIWRMFGEGVKKSWPKCWRIHGEGRFSCPANGKQCRQYQQYGHFERYCCKGVNKIEGQRTQNKRSDRHQRRSERDREEEDEERTSGTGIGGEMKRIDGKRRTGET